MPISTEPEDRNVGFSHCVDLIPGVYYEAGSVGPLEMGYNKEPSVWKTGYCVVLLANGERREINLNEEGRWLYPFDERWWNTH